MNHAVYTYYTPLMIAIAHGDYDGVENMIKDKKKLMQVCSHYANKEAFLDQPILFMERETDHLSEIDLLDFAINSREHNIIRLLLNNGIKLSNRKKEAIDFNSGLYSYNPKVRKIKNIFEKKKECSKKKCIDIIIRYHKLKKCIESITKIEPLYNVLKYEVEFKILMLIDLRSNSGQFNIPSELIRFYIMPELFKNY